MHLAEVVEHVLLDTSQVDSVVSRKSGHYKKFGTLLLITEPCPLRNRRCARCAALMRQFTEVGLPDRLPQASSASPHARGRHGLVDHLPFEVISNDVSDARHL